MNWEHFRTFAWLRWRLHANQWRRAGKVNAILWTIVAVGAVLVSVVSFVVFLFVGRYALQNVPPTVILFVWDGLAVALLFFWMIGLLAELQRSEVLSLDKFMHLPVSLTGAFLINYFSSLLSLSLLVFVPSMVGLGLGLAWGRGLMLLLFVPPMLAFLLALTALTYQFQGWLASLMVNKRRRRAIITFIALAFILVAQLPNLINIIRPWDRQGPDELLAEWKQKETQLDQERIAGRITPQEYQQRSDQAKEAYEEARRDRNRQTWAEVQRIAWIVNVAVPAGWLPLGVMEAAEGHPLPALLGTLGLGLIGTASLWRAYRTTVRLYTGQYSGGAPRRAAAAPTPAPAGPDRGNFLEKELPGISGPAAAIALGGFRSLTRAPEAKMLLLTPIIMVVVFGGLFLRHNPGSVPELLRPLMALGAAAMMFVTMIQLVGNQFGFDRGGFRVFVLSGTPRRDILLGKNLAVAPLALSLSALLIVAVQVVQPMRIDHFLAVWPMLVAMYLVFCALGNLLSMLAPMPMAAGTFKPKNAKLIPVLLHLAFFFAIPIVIGPMLFPVGVEALVEGAGGPQGWPIALALAVVECAVIVILYRLVLTWEGMLLQAREQKILETVVTRDE